MLVENMVFWLGQTSPALLRSMLRLYAHGRPVITMAGNLLVLSSAAAREVLERPSDFLTSRVYSPRIKLEGGPCLLGVDPSPQYERELGALRRALANSDAYASNPPSTGAALDPSEVANKFRDVLDREYTQTARKFAVAGTIDVGALIERTLVRSFARFYGIDPDAAHSCRLRQPTGTETLAYWLRKAGSLIALPSPAPWGFEEEGTRSSGELSAFLLKQARATVPAQPPQWRSLIANLRAGRVLNQPDDIARSVGVMMLAGTTTIKAITLALHELLSHDLQSKRAADAAQRGDEETVFAYAQEALRFRPVFPFLGRYSPHDTVLGRGRSWETKVPAGTGVMVSPMTAMFDEDEVIEPDQFMVDRPAKTYLHFGHEVEHTCIGKHLAVIAVRFVLTRLLKERAMRAGTIRYDGAAIASYVLEQQCYDARAVPGYAPGAA
jgi:cytochrome P450